MVDALNLVHTLFWPVLFDVQTTAFNHRFHAALLTDAAGLCAILRDLTAGVDHVYMSPKGCGTTHPASNRERPCVILFWGGCEEAGPHPSATASTPGHQ